MKEKKYSEQIFRVGIFGVVLAASAVVYGLPTAVTDVVLDPAVWSVLLLNLGFLNRNAGV